MFVSVFIYPKMPWGQRIWIRIHESSMEALFGALFGLVHPTWNCFFLPPESFLQTCRVGAPNVPFASVIPSGIAFPLPLSARGPAADGTEWLHRKDALTPLSQSINRYSKTDHFIGHVCHGKNCHGKHFSHLHEVGRNRSQAQRP